MQLPEILNDFGVTYFDGHGHHHCRTGWVQLDCPFCGKNSKKYHLGFNKTKGYFVCWRCGAHGVMETVASLCNVSFAEARKITKDLVFSVDRTIKKQGTLVIPKRVGPLLPAHKEYLRGRGFDPALIARLWGVKGIGLDTRLAWRLWIPITYRGETVSWTTRSISDKGLRYVSASAEQESIPHKSLLYGEDLVRGSSVVVVEGPIDAWAIGCGAVATCGTAFSQAQLLRLSKRSKIVVCFDSSTQAQIRAQKLSDELLAVVLSVSNVVLEAKDAACASKRELALLRKVSQL